MVQGKKLRPSWSLNQKRVAICLLGYERRASDSTPRCALVIGQVKETKGLILKLPIGELTFYEKFRILCF